mgnify:CR=1 FL=1|jgi:hypothetical protein
MGHAVMRFLFLCVAVIQIFSAFKEERNENYQAAIIRLLTAIIFILIAIGDQFAEVIAWLS